MSFFQDIFGGAKRILQDQLGSEIEYRKGEGIVSDTGNKPKILGTGKEFLFPGRGFSDEEINSAELNKKDTAIAVARTAGEIVQGGVSLLHMGGTKLADTLLPGYDPQGADTARANAIASTNKYVQPTNAAQARAMRGGDILGFVPGAGTIKHAGKADAITDIINARKGSIVVDAGRTADDGKKILSVDPDDLITTANLDKIDQKKLDSMTEALRNGEDLGTISVTVRDGNITISDGNMRALAARNAGEMIDVVDDTPVPTTKKKSPIQAVTEPRKTGGAFDIQKFNADDVVKKRVAERKAARGGQTLSEKSKQFIENFENKIIDFTSPIQRRYDDAIKADPNFKASQKFETNIKDNIDRVLNTPAITSGFVRQNGLEDIIQGVDNLDEFDQYVAAKHILDLPDDVVQKSKFNLDEERALVEAFDGKYAAQADQLSQYNKKTLDYMEESGILSKESRTALEAKYPNYVPLQRVFADDEIGNAIEGAGSGVASLSQQSVVQKITGSERKIESPMESILQNAEKMIRQGEKNKASQKIISYKDIEGNPFGLRQLKTGEKAAADKGTITALVNGKPQRWEVAADVAKAAKALNVQQLNILGKILSMPVRLARLGITGINLPFVAANVARDQVSSFIMSDNGLRSSILNPRVWLAGLGDSIKHGKLHDDMISEGALMTSFDISRNKVTPTLNQIRSNKDLASKAKYTVTNPQEWLRTVENVVGRSEEIARKQQYKGAYEKAIEEGATVAQANNVAARAARENSTNFARRGEWGTVMNNTWLYLNAGIQGSRLLVRNLKNKPAATSAKITSSLMLPMATVTYWNLNDPERKEAYDDIQDYEKENNFIIVPPNPTKDENGRWNVIKIPLPPGVGQFANFVRRPIEASQGLDELQFSEAASNMLRTFSPVDVSKPVNTVTPQALKPAVQYATGQNLFTGNDTVPQSMQDLPNEQQVKDNTSGTAELVGNALGASPIKTEQVVKDTLGGIGPQILNASDRLLNKAGVLDDDQIGGQTLPDAVSRRFNSAAGGKSEQEQMTEIFEIKKEARGQSAATTSLAEEMNAAFKELPPEEANAQMRELKETDRVLYDKIKSIAKEDALGLSGPERAIKGLPVKDGTRANYIFEQTERIAAEEGPDAANAYIRDLKEKKVITDAVMKQIKDLKANGTI